jgi:hypothetical protein
MVAAMGRHYIGICLLVLLALTTFFPVDASNFNKPHTHTGKVEPFQPGDPKVKLDGKALGILKAGKPYQVCLIWIISLFLY